MNNSTGLVVVWNSYILYETVEVLVTYYALYIFALTLSCSAYFRLTFGNSPTPR